MSTNFSIHVFAYGETQYIKDDINFKTETTELTTVQPLLDAIWAEKPADVTGDDEYSSVSVFDYDLKKWLGKQEDSATFVVAGEDSLVDLIDAVIAEITALIPQE